MKCIICRIEKEEFSDEHVIPDSLNGYYHIKSVCKDCNSIIGRLVDSKLVNHKFIEFQRYELKIKGKTGSIPNPLSGTHKLKDNPDQKVRMELDKEGNLTPRLLPVIPEIKKDGNLTTFSFSIDIQDLRKKDEIINKILKRNGINKDNITFQQTNEKQSRPWIDASMSIDIRDFKIGLLKIAYEFAVDSIEPYFEDLMAVTISEILLNCDVKRMENEKIILGSGIDKEINKPLSHLIDFDNKNHYLILMDIEDIGLVCQVNIFDCFSIWVRLSKINGYLGHNVIIGVNDIANKKFERLTSKDLYERTFSKPAYRFEYWFPNKEKFEKFVELQKHPDFSFYRNEGGVPLFDKQGNIKYKDIGIKLKQDQLMKILKGDEINECHTQFIMDENLYIKTLPGMDLHQIVSIQEESYRIGKL